MLVYMLACHILSPTPHPPPEGLVGCVRGRGGGVPRPLLWMQFLIQEEHGVQFVPEKKGKKKGGKDARVRYNGMFLIKVNQPVDNKRTFH